MNNGYHAKLRDKDQSTMWAGLCHCSFTCSRITRL